MNKPSPRPGEFVTNADIAAYALPGHRPCNGSGFTRRDREELCDCARGRFLDVNIFRIWPDDSVDALRWGPNPPSRDEIREAGRRVGTAMLDFIKMAQPDKASGEPK